MIILAISIILVIVFLKKFFRHIMSVDRIFVSLPYSHYVEIARWSMTKAGESFYELKIPVGPHVVLIPMLRLFFSNGKVSDSSFPGVLSKNKKPVPYLRRMSAIPYTIGKKSDHHDSWSIMKSCGFNIDEFFRLRFDMLLGPRVR